VFQDKKLRTAISRNQVIGTLQMTFGGFFAFIFGLTSISCIINTFIPNRRPPIIDTLVIIVIFALSFSMLIHGIRRIRLAKKYSRYLSLLVQRQSYSIDQIANIMKSPVLVVRSDFAKLIKKGIIDSSYIVSREDSTISDQDYQTLRQTAKLNLMNKRDVMNRRNELYKLKQMQGANPISEPNIISEPNSISEPNPISEPNLISEPNPMAGSNPIAESNPELTPNSPLIPNPMPDLEKPAQTIGSTEFVTIICKSCGASSKIGKGINADCEFCGSVIQ